MYKEVLYKNQVDILNVLSLFSRDFYLAGGTAISLHLGHRKSLDFDLFSAKPIKANKILQTLKNHGLYPDRTLVDNAGEELTLIVSGVKLTFLYYPFSIDMSGAQPFQDIKIPSIEMLGAMKFYTLGRRGKWKDYVDIYQILNSGYSFKTISEHAEQIFTGGYNEKLLREQLCYFDDIDYSEEVEYIGKTLLSEEIKRFLINIAKS